MQNSKCVNLQLEMDIGKYNTLKVTKERPQGFYLEDLAGNEILLPTKYIPQGLKVEDDIEVFVYKDSENRPIATTLIPNIVLDEFAVLRVKEVNELGAFMEWGIAKDVFVPFAEQKIRMEVGRYYIVILYYDEKSERLVGSSKYGDFVCSEDIGLKMNDEVELLIADKTDLGYNVIINNEFVGLLFFSDVHQRLQYGQIVPGFIKKIRADQKIDVSLQKFGYRKVEASLQAILDKLERNKGYLNLNDKSDPEIINEVFSMSKKTFKKSIGALYKQRLIRIEKDGIHLV